jgi:hypothetical protein
MDRITTAIVAALPALATDMVSGVVKDPYAVLKSLILRKFGATSAVAKSVEDLEANPKSQGGAMVLSEQVGEVRATSDPEIMTAVTKSLRRWQRKGTRENPTCVSRQRCLAASQECARAKRFDRNFEPRWPTWTKLANA